MNKLSHQPIDYERLRQEVRHPTPAMMELVLRIVEEAEPLQSDDEASVPPMCDMPPYPRLRSPS
jgi:hypothetical protein